AGLREIRRELESSPARAVRLRQVLVPRAPPLIEDGARGRDPRPGGAVLRIEPDRALEHPQAFFQGRMAGGGEMVPGAQVVLVRRRCGLRSAERLLLSERQLAAQRRRDVLGDLVLDREDVADLAVEALGPAVVAAARLDELHRHAQAITHLADAALEERRDPQLAP